VSLKLYNTRTRTKEEFKPLDPANVRMYVCGPTVYDYAHIGNARPVIVFDVLYRLLRHLAAKGEWDGGKGQTTVTYVRNITDVDDKINARAVEQYPELPPEAAIRKLTEETAAQYHKDVAALGCLPPTHEPRATEYIEQMKAMIETLVDKGCAYIAEDHALFHVSAMPDYGQLARRSLDEMRAGARVEVAPYKRDPMDFVLWKPSKEGEPSWPSPRGIAAPGRPGWHLECSAMAKALLGETFDIHGGGIDLVFPHHENEVAQSRCAHGTDVMANVWMHNGHLQVEGAKMSKSDGNFSTIDELLQDWPGEVLRFNMLRTHYRQPIDWTLAGLAESADALDKIRKYARVDKDADLPQSVIDAALDDLNTPQIIAELYSIFKAPKNAIFSGHSFAGKGFLQPSQVRNKSRLARGVLIFLGLEGVLEANWRSRKYQATTSIDQPAVARLIAMRKDARNAKNWAEADRIRDELAAMGIALKDAKDPATGEIVTTWEIAR
jgi:cysteinyl-tRNA synthetase